MTLQDALKWFENIATKCDDCQKYFDYTCSGAELDKCAAYRIAISANNSHNKNRSRHSSGVFMPRKESRMVIVTDDWYPCFDNSTIKLSIMSEKLGEIYYCKIMAWGADDTGVEMEYRSYFHEMVDGIYEHWKEYLYNLIPDGVNRRWFFEHGFYVA